MTFPVPLTRRARVDDLEIAWDCWGSDDLPTLVLVHGFSGSACDFDHLIPDLQAQGRRVVLLEQRGHGRSGRSADYSLDALASDLVSVLPQLAAEPVTLLGHSMGGRVVMMAAARAPHLVRHLVLMDTSAWSFRRTDPEEAAVIGAFLEAYDPSTGLPDALPAGPEEELVTLAGDAQHLAARKQMQERFDPYALKQLGQEIFAGDVSFRDQLAHLTMPVTVVVGSLDEPYVSQAPELARLTGGALTVIDGAYHSPQLTHAPAWLAALDTLT